MSTEDWLFAVDQKNSYTGPEQPSPETRIELFERLHKRANDGHTVTENERRALDKAYGEALEEWRATQANNPPPPKPKTPQPRPVTPAPPPIETRQVEDTPQAQSAPLVRQDDGPPPVSVDRQPRDGTISARSATVVYHGQYTSRPAEEVASRVTPPPTSEAERKALVERIKHNDPEPGEPHPTHAEDFARESVAAADPVELFTGAFVVQVTDLAVPSALGPIGFERRYRSGLPYFSTLGFGWDHSFNIYLRPLRGGDLALWDGRLHEQRFRVERGTWSGPPELGAALVPLPAPADGFELTFPRCVRWRFERPPGWPLAQLIPLTGVADRHGNTMTLSYDAAGRLASVLDDAGRGLRFSYGECGLLERLADHTGTRVVNYYHHDESEHLVQVIQPATASFPKGVITRYDYDLYNPQPAMQHNILRLTDACGRVFLENDYSGPEAGWGFNTVARQVVGEHEYLFEYEQLQWVAPDPLFLDIPATRTCVGMPDGSLHTYTFNYRGDLLDRRFRLNADRTYRVIASQWRYDEQGHTVEATGPDGGRTLFEYDTSNANPCARHNLLQVEITAPLPALEPSRLLMRAEYDPIYQLPRCLWDEAGRETRAEYDFDSGDPNASGRLRRVALPEATLPDGRRQSALVTFEHNTGGQVTAVVAPGGGRSEYAYIAGGAQDGFLRRVTEDAGGIAELTELGYDAMGFPAWIRVPGGARADFSVNLMGQLEQILLPEVDGFRPAIRQRFGESGVPVRVEHPLGDYLEAGLTDDFLLDLFELDDLGRVTAVHQGANTSAPRHARSRLDYAGRVVTVWDGSGRRSNYRYDERGLLISETLGVNTPEQATWRYSYDSAGRLRETTDPVGGRTAIARDAWGRQEKITHPKPKVAGNDRRVETIEVFIWGRGDRLAEHRIFGSPSPGQAARMMHRVSCEFDERGRRIGHTVWSFDQDPAVAVPMTTRVVYNPDDQPERLVLPRGGEIETTYDGLGRVRQVTDVHGNRTIYAYDSAGNLARLDQDDLDDGVVRRRTTRYSYDARARLRRVEAPHIWSELDYDQRDVLLQRREPDGVVVRFAHNAFAEPIEMLLDPGGLDIRTLHGYDSAGRLESIVSPTGETTRWEYDGLGRAAALLLPDGSRWERRLDGLNRPVSQRMPSGASLFWAYLPGTTGPVQMWSSGPFDGPASIGLHEFAYDGLGRLVSATNPAGVTKRRYDSRGRVTYETSFGAVVESRHDDERGGAELLYPDGRRERTQYDAGGRPQRVDLVQPGLLGGVAGEALLEIAYAGALRPARLAHGNGVEAILAYDGAARLAALGLVRDGTSIVELRLLYDERSRRAVIQRLGVDTLNTLHRYDRRDRLVEARVGFPLPALAAGLPPVAKAAALAGASAASMAATHTERYELDSIDARRRLDRSGPGAGVTSYVLGPVGKVRAAGGTPIVYHADGHRRADARFAYEVDALNRLVRVREAVGGIPLLEINYDALGRPASGRSGGVPFRRWFAGPACIHEQLGGQVTQISPHPLWPLPLCLVGSTGTAYAHADGAHSTICLTGPVGKVREWHNFGAFGEAQVLDAVGAPLPGPSAPWRVTWRGLPLLPDLKLYSSPSRLYDPDLGVFLSQDPLLYRDSPSAYVFAAHNPVDFADVSGMAKSPLGEPPPAQQREPDWTTQTNPAWTFREFGDDPPVPIVRSVDTGLGATANVVVNQLVAPWTNLLAAWENAAILSVVGTMEAIDRKLRSPSFNPLYAEYEISGQVLPMMMPLGLAAELPGGLRYLRYWLGNNRTLNNIALRSVFSLTSVGGGVIGGGLRRGDPKPVFMRRMLRIINESADHPLKFLVNPVTKDWKARIHLSEEEGVQAGHLLSRWMMRMLGEPDRLAVEDALYNQLSNWKGETGRRAWFTREAVQVEGVVVELESLKLWATEHPILKQYLSGARVSGWVRD